MPMIVPVAFLESGLVVAETLLGSSGQLLLAKGTILSDLIIEALRRSSIESVKVCLPDELESKEEPLFPIPADREVQVKSQIRELFTLLQTRRTLPVALLDRLSASLHAVADALFSDGGVLFSNVKHLAHHDEYTYEHSWMVMVLSLALAKKAVGYGVLSLLDWQDRINLGLGSLLHDVGKMQVPEEILNKPDVLSVDEMELMRKHPQWGLEIVRRHERIMPMARGIVVHHHQRWDGKGYGPSSGELLSGEDIPCLVRLVSIADAYDALVSDRPYRPGFLPWEAMEILERAGGSHFDPYLVGLVRDVVEDFPVGAVLLLRSGAIAVVQAGQREGDVVECTILGSLSERTRALVGQRIGVPPGNILCGGNSFLGLVRRLAAKPELLRGVLAGEVAKLTFLSPWSALAESHLSPLLEGRDREIELPASNGLSLRSFRALSSARQRE